MAPAETAGKPARWNAARALGRTLAALVLGLMAVAMCISVAAIVYQGPLHAFLDRAIAFALIAGIVMGIASATLFSYRGTICQPQTSLAVVFGLSTASIAAAMPDPASERSFATAAGFVVATTLTAGLLACLLGRLRAGRAGRFIPFPVVTGFLAATGYLMVAGGIGTAIGEPVDIRDLPRLFDHGLVVRWLPWALTAVVIAIVARRLRRPLVLPVGLLLAGGAFYLVLAALGLGLADAERHRLLLGPFGEGFLQALGGLQPMSIDGPALAAQTPNMLTAIGLCMIGAVLSASAIEVASATPIDLDRDLRGVGIANLLAGLGGGTAGHHSLSQTFLALGLGSFGRGNGWIVTVACVLALTVGAPIIAALPVGVFAAGIIVVGLNLLLASFVDHRNGMPAADFAVVVGIPAVTALFGFLWGVAVGLLAAAIFFVGSFARIDVIRVATNGARMRSRLERPEADQQRLSELGRQAAVYGLEGYLFFGTAHRLVQRIERALDGGQPLRHVVIDFGRLRGLDTSAARAFARLAAACEARTVALHFAGLGEADARLLRAQLGSEQPRFFAALEQALEAVEAELLEPAAAAPDAPAGFLADLRGRHPSIDLDGYFDELEVPAGCELIAEGAAADSLLVLRSGLLRAEVSAAGGAAITLARFLPGALVGEIGLYAGMPRTARVVAEVPSTVLRIDSATLDRMGRAHPALLADFHRLIAATLARRLSRTTALLADSELQPG